MSKIQVDAIEQQTACGTTLTAGGGAGKTVVVDATTVTLGRCGGTVALASGASQTGFGRTGTVDWNTTPKTATFTAVSGDGFFANTTGSAFNMNLPAGVAGAIVSVADYAGTWQTNALTVVSNGSDKIGGVNANVALNTEGQSVTFIFVDSTQGWINTMDSTSNARGNAFIVASGGTVTCLGNERIHTFTGPGTFNVSTAALCAANNLVSYMVVAGGGGGAEGASCGGGGGGAGGYREVVSPTSPYTGSPTQGYPTPGNRITVTATGYPITVGAGGTAGAPPTSDSGGNGQNSIFSTITSTGGGGGGTNSNPAGSGGASNGGSGGGGSYINCSGSGNTPPTTPAQGTDGGDKFSSPNPVYYSGQGGGGATVKGSTGGPSGAGAGGTGATSSINGTPTARAGGGGGSGSTNGPPTPGGAGGTGGGGAGAAKGGGVGTAGTVNTGGGGGGGGYPGSNGAQGGSGIVIIRYKFQ